MMFALLSTAAMLLLAVQRILNLTRRLGHLEVELRQTQAVNDIAAATIGSLVTRVRALTHPALAAEILCEDAPPKGPPRLHLVKGTAANSREVEEA